MIVLQPDAALAADAVKVVIEGIRRAEVMTPLMVNYSFLEDGVVDERPGCFNDSVEPSPYGRQLIKAMKEVSCRYSASELFLIINIGVATGGGPGSPVPYSGAGTGREICANPLNSWGGVGSMRL